MSNRLLKNNWIALYRISRFEDWLLRRFTDTGQLVLGAAFVGALFGVDTRKTLGVQIFGFGLSLILIALISSLRRPKDLTATRHLPRYATVGVPVRYRVQLKNYVGRTAKTLVIQERPPDPRPNLETFLNSKAPWEHKINFLDRLSGYPRWRWLVHKGRYIEKGSAVNVPTLVAGGETIVELEFTPCRRGPLILSGLEIRRMDPLGLCWQRKKLKSHDRLLVLPQRYSIPPQHLSGRRRLQSGGVTLAATVGDSQEFIGLRDYRAGDSIRHIYWAAWARSGKAVVKEYQDEYFSRQALILDSFVPPEREEDFEIAVSVAASFVEPLTGGDALLDLMFVADHAYTLTGGRGVMSTNALLEALACVKPQIGNFAILSQAILAHAPLLSAGIGIFLTWEAPQHELVHRLRVLGIPLTIFIVGGPLQFEYGPMADQPQHLHRLEPQNIAAELMAL